MSLGLKPEFWRAFNVRDKSRTYLRSNSKSRQKQQQSREARAKQRSNSKSREATAKAEEQQQKQRSNSKSREATAKAEEQQQKQRSNSKSRGATAKAEEQQQKQRSNSKSRPPPRYYTYRELALDHRAVRAAATPTPTAINPATKLTAT
jgi:hypothetical protein